MTTGFALTAKQAEANKLIGAAYRHIMLVGGSRSGKTFLLVRAIVTRALKAKSRHVIFRMRGNACRSSVWLDTFNSVMKVCYPMVTVTPHLMDSYVSLPNGSEIWFAGLDDKERVEKILGMEFATVYFNECSQIPYASVVVALTRLAQKVEGLKNRAFYDLNPTTNKHWTYQLFIDHVDPQTRLPRTDGALYAWTRINPVDNEQNIDPDYLAALHAMPERSKKRFLHGNYLQEIDGALWTPEILERQRIDISQGNMDYNRIIIAVDPSGCSGEEDKRSDEIGISVMGRVGDSGYVLNDSTMRGSPEGWGRRTVELYHAYKADCIVGEKNYGGDMVRAIIQGIDPNVKFKAVTATRGKVVRAEPISALYENHKIFHVGEFEKLEDELLNFTTDGYKGDRSPNRADALVWAAHEIMLGSSTDGLLRFYEQWAKQISGAAA